MQPVNAMAETAAITENVLKYFFILLSYSGVGDFVGNTPLSIRFANICLHPNASSMSPLHHPITRNQEKPRVPGTPVRGLVHFLIAYPQLALWANVITPAPRAGPVKLQLLISVR